LAAADLQDLHQPQRGDRGLLGPFGHAVRQRPSALRGE
jgi:hypothetical protein